MDVLDAIRTKKAVRQFTDDPIPPDVLAAILDAGRRSQSSKNTQPWQFIVVQDRAILEALSKTGAYAGHMAQAAVAVVLVGTERTHGNSFDLGQAAAYLQLAAWELGVGSCLAALYDEEAVHAILHIPAEMTSSIALSFGYPTADFQPAKMGGRRSLDDLVRWDTWT